MPRGRFAPAPAQQKLAAGEKVPSPMPGTILELKVKAGDAVKAGQVILIMESMKMENEITSPRDGTVAQVVAAKGQTVATDDPLIILA